MADDAAAQGEATKLHDLAVVGGGLIGAAAALGAAQQGLRVLLLDRVRPVWRPGRLGMDVRNVAVSPASQGLLHRLGVWRDQDAVPYTHMRVWEERGTRAIEFDAAEVAREELGWILENGPLVDRLWQKLDALDNVVLLTGNQVADLDPGPQDARLTLGPVGDGSGAETTIRARLVIGADGARSSVRELLRVRADSFDTGHHALATVVRTARPHKGRAFQRFLLDGPLALLPGKDPRQSAVVWSQSPSSAARRADLDETSFCDELANAAENCLGAVDAVDQRLVFPLQ